MKKWLIIGIVLLGFSLRTIGLSNHPAGFTPDEASFGYDAYSILKTGRDQWRHEFPLVLKSFGDDKLPLYAYLDIPFVALMGLNETAVRFPNALLGTFAILVVYFLVRELKIGDWKLEILASFLLAISPWHVMLSRGAFEANLTTFLLPLGILLFLLGLKKKSLLVLSAVIFGLNLFSYHTARLLTPLVILFLTWHNWKEFKKYILLFGIVFAVFLIPAIYFYFIGNSRIASSGIFDLGFAGDRYLAQVVGEPGLIAKIFYNRPVYIFRQFITNYLSYFSPQFLFTQGSAEGTYGMVPGIGVLYLVEFVFLGGFILSVVRKNVSKEVKLILFWILISPIPASLTKGPGYAANRVAFIMPAIQIVLAVGGIFFYEKFKTKESRQLFTGLYMILILVNFIFVIERYWVGQIVNQAPSMIYGVNQIVNDLQRSENENRIIIVSKNISEPQIYLAFYTGMNPVNYQNSSKNWVLVNGWVDQQGEYSLGKYKFRNINYSVDAKLKNTILVGVPKDFPEEIRPDFIVNYPNLRSAYYIVSGK